MKYTTEETIPDIQVAIKNTKGETFCSFTVKNDSTEGTVFDNLTLMDRSDDNIFEGFYFQADQDSIDYIDDIIAKLLILKREFGKRINPTPKKPSRKTK